MTYETVPNPAAMATPNVDAKTVESPPVALAMEHRHAKGMLY